jgi:hypothetical protein
MSNPSLFEKLELKDEKNLLIQGVPSSIEKQFAKLSYAKNVTPLLKNKKIDFALVFGVNQAQLINILKEVFVALHPNSKLWIAFPKQTSKIVSDLNRKGCWDFMKDRGYDSLNTEDLDNVWNAMRFKRNESFVEPPIVVTPKVNVEIESTAPTQISADANSGNVENNVIVPPVELEKIFKKHKEAKEFFTSLSANNQKEYVNWIQGAKKEETRHRRADVAIEKLTAGKKNPTEK